MANYVEQDLNLRLPGQPWTSAKAIADAENLLAQAEGAPGAPKVVSEALDMFVGAGQATTEFTGLDRVDKVLLTGFAGYGGGSSVSVSYNLSTDNGENWLSFVSVVNVTNTSAVSSRTVPVVISLGADHNAIRVNISGAGNGNVASFSILGVSGVIP